MNLDSITSVLLVSNVTWEPPIFSAEHEELVNDTCSLGDFPEIVDEDPDEEDRV
jgi:hypothetical protein